MARKNLDESNSLALAMRKGNIRACKILLKFYPNAINKKNNEGNTPLHSVVSSNSIIKNVLIMFLFRNENLNPNIKNMNGNTPLHEAISEKNNKDKETIKLLVNNPLVDINAKNRFNLTPFEDWVRNYSNFHYYKYKIFIEKVYHYLSVINIFLNREDLKITAKTIEELENKFRGYLYFINSNRDYINAFILETIYRKIKNIIRHRHTIETGENLATASDDLHSIFQFNANINETIPM